MIWDEEHLARAGLTYAVPAGNQHANEKIKFLGAEEFWQSLRSGNRESVWAKRAKNLDLNALIEQATENKLRFIIPGDTEWPNCLDDLAECVPNDGVGGMPIGLWVRGPKRLSELANRSIAIVGSRACSQYGKNIAIDMAAELAQPDSTCQGLAGWTVVSGGAYGIDAAAHQGALAVSGETVAVMAGGLDSWYPKTNSAIFEKIAAQSAVVSELPPGIHPTRPGFLARNRVIAALSRATIVVEAAARSGAKNTARWSESLSRPLFAVPGSVNSVMSVTTNRLIRDHEAQLVTCTKDVLGFLADFSTLIDLPTTGEDRPTDALTVTQLLVYDVLPLRGGYTLDEVAIKSGLNVRQCAIELQNLLDLGFADLDSAGTWIGLQPKKQNKLVNCQT